MRYSIEIVGVQDSLNNPNNENKIERYERRGENENLLSDIEPNIENDFDNERFT